MGEKEGNPLFTLNELIQLQVTFACWSEMLDIFPFKGELHHCQVLHSSFAPALMFHRVHSLLVDVPTFSAKISTWENPTYCTSHGAELR